MTLWLSLYGKEWGRDVRLPAVHDDQAVLVALEALWKLAHAALPRSFRVVQVAVTLSDITRAARRSGRTRLPALRGGQLEEEGGGLGVSAEAPVE